MQSQSGFNDAKDIMKPTNPLSPRRRVLGELSANSRRKVSPSSTKCIHSSFNSPAQRKSPIQSCLKSSTLSPTAPPKRSAAHIINTVEGAENQAGNTIHTSDNNSKKRSIDQVNSLVPEQPSGRTSMRHTPSVSMSLLENENAMSDDKDPEESLDSAKASTRTSQMTQIDHGASATKAINDYATSDEALAGDETNAIAGARTATKAQAENLRLRLRVAVYKVRTNQTRVPLSNLRLEAQSTPAAPAATPSAPTIAPPTSSSLSMSASLSSCTSSSSSSSSSTPSEQPTNVPT